MVYGTTNEKHAQANYHTVGREGPVAQSHLNLRAAALTVDIPMSPTTAAAAVPMHRQNRFKSQPA